MRTTKQVLEHHLEAVVTANLTEIGRDYDDSSKMLVSPQGIQPDKAAIMKFFESLLPVLKSGKFELKQQLVEGKAAMIVYDFKSPSMNVQGGVDSFFIEDGVIRYQTMKT